MLAISPQRAKWLELWGAPRCLAAVLSSCRATAGLRCRPGPTGMRRERNVNSSLIGMATTSHKLDKIPGRRRTSSFRSSCGSVWPAAHNLLRCNPLPHQSVRLLLMMRRLLQRRCGQFRRCHHHHSDHRTFTICLCWTGMTTMRSRTVPSACKALARGSSSCACHAHPYTHFTASASAAGWCVKARAQSADLRLGTTGRRASSSVKRWRPALTQKPCGPMLACHDILNI